MTKDEAIALAVKFHIDAEEGERPTGATERWVELADSGDESQPTTVTDTRCWVVEFSGDRGPSMDWYLGVDDGQVVKLQSYG